MKNWKKSILAYVLIWLFCVLWFWLGSDGGGWIMAYTLLSFCVILPIATLLTAFYLEWKQNLGLWRWISIIAFGILYAAAILATFVLSTVIGETNIAYPSPYILLVGSGFSTIGILVGWLVRTQRISLKVPVIIFSVLLAAVYIFFKTLNGSFFRFLPILDIPAIILTVIFIGVYIKKKRTEYLKTQSFLFSFFISSCSFINISRSSSVSI